MRREVKDIRRQAEEDFTTAQVLIKGSRFYASVFFSQQVAEKVLKALYLYKKRRLPQSHNLIELASALRAPEKVLKSARELNPEYLTTRYVDAANGVPADMYDKESAKVHLDCAMEILQWAKRLIK
jgi:HEPN domain-containing protein